MTRRPGRPALGLTGVVVLASALAGCSSGRPAGAAIPAVNSATARATQPPAPSATVAPTTVAPTTGVPATVATLPPTTTPTTDPGLLPQTTQLPSATDPGFLTRVSDLWQAVITGDTALADQTFFPLSAYIQVKGISDPVHDYQTRLIPDFNQDIQTLHTQIPPYATFTSVTVPNAAQWILPGVEYNKGSYWRVYGTRISFSVAGQDHYFDIASMISWRGEWYVVHLLSIR